MKISVKIIPNAKIEKIEREPDGSLKVWIRAKAVEGEANKRLIDLMAEHFNVSKNQVTIKLGAKSREKLLEIGE